MEIIEIIILGIFFYIIGSIPFAYLLPKLFGIGDIRKIGSGNVGATNVLRLGNKKIAAIVLLLDILKGFLPFLYFKNLNNFSDIFYIEFSNAIIIYFLAALPIIGHLFPIWLRFKGGKGVATYIGFLLGSNYIFGIIFIFSWLVIASVSKYSSLSSIVSLLIIPLVIVIFFSFNFQVICLFFAISALIIFKHYSNILRLFNKTESKIRF